MLVQTLIETYYLICVCCSLHKKEFQVFGWLNARFDVLLMVSLETYVLWNVTLFYWMNHL